MIPLYSKELKIVNTDMMFMQVKIEGEYMGIIVRVMPNVMEVKSSNSKKYFIPRSLTKFNKGSCLTVSIRKLELESLVKSLT